MEKKYKRKRKSYLHKEIKIKYKIVLIKSIRTMPRDNEGSYSSYLKKM